MDLPDTYRKIVKPTIVAFIRKWIEAPLPGVPFPQFPSIIGTGFVINPNGWIATNRHVAEEFLRAPDEVRGAKGNSPLVMAMLFCEQEDGMHTPAADVEEAFVLNAPAEMLTQYCREQPDFALIRIAVRELPYLDIETNRTLAEGQMMATAGFPMGTDALTASGQLGHISPSLQTGVISSLLPFPCSHPHGYLLNVMTRGGASGSPLFYPDSGAVAGILHSGLYDYEKSRVSTYRIPTNFSYILPSHVISTLIDIFRAQGNLTEDPNVPTLDDLLANNGDQADIGIPWEPIA